MSIHKVRSVNINKTISPKVSVVIPTYNRAHILKRVIPSYLSQKYVIELIIIDDCSEENVWGVAEEFKDNPYNVEIVCIRNKRRMLQPTTRNIGVSVAKGNLIFMGEDDVELPRSHILTLYEEMCRQKADIVAGRCINVRKGLTVKESVHLADMESGPVFKEGLLDAFFWRKDDRFTWNLPAVALMRKKIFEYVRYDPRYRGTAHREETDFYLSCYKLGYKLFFTSKTCCFHYRGIPGGCHMSNIEGEYWALKNTLIMLRKHRKILEETFSPHSLGRIFLRWFLWRCGLAARILFRSLLCQREKR